MKTSHEVRNWLHYLILAAQAVDYQGVANCFARQHPLSIRGPRPGDEWSSWESWSTFLATALSVRRIGDLYLRMTQQPEITIDPSESEVCLRWQMTYRLGSRANAQIGLDCEATLVMEEQRWLARSLSCLPLLAPPESSD